MQDSGTLESQLEQGPIVKKGGATHVLDGAHHFSIGTAHIAGRDVHIHYPTEDAKPADIVDIAVWLCGRNYRQYHATTVLRRAANTGSWFFDTPEIKNWLAAEHGTLWVTGMPGAGKTILASYSIDRLTIFCQRNSRISLAYVYCRYIDNCTAGDVLRTFLRQLGEDHEQVYPIIQQMYEKHRIHQTQLPDSDATDALGDVARLFKQSFFVIDGLDEMPDAEKTGILQSLQKLPVHLLILSRRLDAFMAFIPSMKTLSIEAQAGDIEAFARDRIRNTHRLHRLLQNDHQCIQEVVNKIQRNASGMFLIAALQLEALAWSTNLSSLMTALEALPHDLDAMYDWTLQRIEAQPQEEALLAKRALLWLTFAKSPLRLDELQCALATSHDPEGFNPKAICPAEIILTACGGLVSIENERAWTGDTHVEVKLIHYTTRQYLQKINDPQMSIHAMNTAITCIVYVQALLAQDPGLENALPVSRGSRSHRHPFLAYAFHSWRAHLEDAHLRTNRPSLDRFCQFIQKFNFVPCARCRFKHLKSVFHTPTQMAVCLGLIDLFRMLEFRDEPHPANNSFTSIHLAIEQRHRDIFAELVHGRKCFNIDVNSFDVKGRTPLIHAIDMAWCARDSASLQIVDILLNHTGVDISLRDRTGRPPIHYAMLMDQILDKLLSHPQCNPNVCMGAEHSHAWMKSEAQREQNLYFGPPFPSLDILHQAFTDGFPVLIQAILDGNVRAVELLLNHPGIDINVCMAGAEKSLAWLIPSHQLLETLLFPTDLYFWSSVTPKRLYFERCRAAVTLICHPTIDPSRVSNEGGRTPLMLAAEFDSESALQKLLLSLRNVNGEPRNAIIPLVKSLIQESISALGVILSGLSLRPSAYMAHRGPKLDQWNTVHAIVNACDRNGMTAIFHAHTRPVFNLLVSCAEVDVNHRDKQGNTLLIYTVVQNNTEAVKALLGRSDIDVNLVNSTGQAPLHLALLNSFTDIAIALLACRNVDVNLRNGVGDAPIHLAARFSHVDVARHILDHTDLNVNLKNQEGDCAIHIATQRGDWKMIEVLLRHPQLNPNRLNRAGYTAIHIATRASLWMAAVQLCLCPHVDVNLRNSEGDSALHIAAECGDSEMVQMLSTRSQFDPNVKNIAGCGPIHLATRFSRVGVAVFLLQNPHLNVNLLDDKGNAALHIATEQGDVRMVQALLRHPKLDPNLFNGSGYAAIHLASRCSPTRDLLPLLYLLADHRIDVNVRDTEGYAPVDLLSSHTTPTAALRTLLLHPQLEKNPHRNRKSFYASCLRITYSKRHHSSKCKRKADWRSIRAYLQNDPSVVNFVGPKGQTVLHHAAREGCEVLVEFILAEFWVWGEVDVWLRDSEGRASVDYARGAGHDGIVKLLLEASSLLDLASWHTD